MRRLFAVLILLTAGLLLLSGAGQTAREEAAALSQEPGEVEHLSSEPEEWSEPSGPGEMSEPYVQEAMISAQVEGQPRITKATVIIWCTFGVIVVALALLTWGIPTPRIFHKKKKVD